ncbi:MAG: Holliday junction branch migration protein RuvA [Phycisphaerae bacterium]
MLVRVSGQLVDVTEESVVLDRDGLSYELLVPRYAVGELAACRGQRVMLHTIQYLEGNPAGGNLIPRLIGFLRPEDREFFRHFTTVKGIGIRKGLRALVEPIVRIARDIEASDAKGLSRLPGIGPRAAEQIIAELRGKVAAFASGGSAATVPPESKLSQAQRDALDLLVAWGDHRGDAERWLARAGQLHPELSNVEGWVKAAYRVKTGAEA